MRARWLGLFSLVLYLFLGVKPAQAGAGKVPTAFAVVIGNNKSLGARRPDLHYADDDAARYFEILRTLAPERTLLLSDFDHDTARLFPALHTLARAPTRVELARAGRELGEGVRAANAAGSETELYFVFAGHGDVDAGTGFIELGDGRFSADDLERWLTAIPFTRAHVILDSCNSFFMLGVRKPGGRYFATPEDAARALATRLKNVGVFLSTSAEGESFEWSELESGIFSHVVRSGLLGAADANGDGAVSYLELAAFVATATADVKNPNMRPHVYARGPNAHDDAPIVHVRGRVRARRLRLTDSKPLRVRLRDSEGLPVLDAHAEARAPLEIALPEAWASGAILERQASGDGPVPSRESYNVPESDELLELAALEPIRARGEARGPSEIFDKLFKHPFGPSALASYVSESNDAAAQRIYGVSREDAARMQLLLGQIESAEHNQRVLAGSTLVGAGALLGGVSAAYFANAHNFSGRQPSEVRTLGGVFAAIGGVYLISGTYALARPWAGERAASDFRLMLRQTGDYSRAFAIANTRLEELAANERRARWSRGIAGGVIALASVAGIVGNELSSPHTEQRIGGDALGGSGLVVGGTLFASAFLLESPSERLLNVWHKEPSFTQFQVAVTPTPGGAFFGASGSF